MPIAFNDYLVLSKPVVGFYRGVRSVTYDATILSCDSDEILIVAVVIAFTPNVHLLSSDTVARVRGVVFTGGDDARKMVIDANFGGISPHYGGFSGPTDVIFNITGTVYRKTFYPTKTLILEVDKSRAVKAFVAFPISASFDEVFGNLQAGDVIQATGRFSKVLKMTDEVTPLTYFDPIYMQDVSPYRISRPVGWRADEAVGTGIQSNLTARALDTHAAPFSGPIEVNTEAEDEDNSSEDSYTSASSSVSFSSVSRPTPPPITKARTNGLKWVESCTTDTFEFSNASGLKRKRVAPTGPAISDEDEEVPAAKFSRY